MTSAAFDYLQRKPHRMSMTLPYSTFQDLEALSSEQGRSMSNLAAFLLEAALEHYRREHGRDQRDST